MSKVTNVAAISGGIKIDLIKAVKAAMTQQKLSQSELARRMRTSRAVVHRILNAQDHSITLATIAAMIQGLDHKIRVKITHSRK